MFFLQFYTSCATSRGVASPISGVLKRFLKDGKIKSTYKVDSIYLYIYPAGDQYP